MTIFSAPVPAAQNRYLTDVNLRIRKDGLAFVVGTGYTLSPDGAHIRDWLNLTVLNNGASAADAVNADNFKDDIPVKYASLAFSPVDGTGYIAWRTVHPNPQNFGYEAYLRVIPPTYNGTTNKNLGAQVRLFDRIGFQLDQPSVAVDAAGYLHIAGYLVANPVQLCVVTLDPNLNMVPNSKLIVDTQPKDARYEMTPVIVVDTANNRHVIASFPSTPAADSPAGVFAYSKIGSAGFSKTNITPASWYPNIRGKRAKDVAVGPGGEVYVAINNTGAYDLYKWAAKPGSEQWTKLQSNVFGEVYNSSVAVGVSLDGTVWAVQGDGKLAAVDPNQIPGTNVKYSRDGGKTFSATDRAIPQTAYSNYSVAVDGFGPGGKVHLFGSFQFDFNSGSARYASTAALGVPVTPPAPAPPPVAPAPLPPVVAAPGGLTVTVLSPTSTKLTWADNSNNEAGFAVERDQSGAPMKEIGRTGTGANWAVDTNLEPSTSYGYRVRAFNAAGVFSDYSPKVIVKTAPAPMPAPPPPAPAPVPTPAPAPAPAPAPGPTDSDVIVLNGFALGHGFKRFFETNGGVPFLGLPLSNEFTDPRSGLVKQVFERYLLTYDKNETNPDWQIKGEDIGRQWLKSNPLP